MDRELTGFILAGGASRRMGTPKAFVRLNGKQLIDYAWEALKEVAPRVMLSAGKLPLSYRDLPVVQDLFVDHGPVGDVIPGQAGRIGEQGRREDKMGLAYGHECLFNGTGGEV